MWGLVCWVGALLREAASASSSGPRTTGRALPRSTLMFLRGGPCVLRWVRGVCFSLWWLRFVGGSLYLYDVEGSTRSCWTGSLVSPCAILSRRVLLFEWLLVVGLRYDVGGALSARRARVLAAPAGPVDGRAATACSCGAESPSPVFVVALFRVSSFSRGRATPSCCAFMFSLSACVRNVVCVYEQTNMVVTTTTT